MPAILQRPERPLLGIQTQFGLTLFVVRTMAKKAPV